jgi:antitoxin component YwqK of YwqJK toxin-antitoxin module
MKSLIAIKRCFFLLTFLGVPLVLSGCWKQTIDFRNAEIKYGRIYRIDADAPFSGSVKNVPVSKILSGQNGMRPLIQALIAIGSASDLGNLLGEREEKLCKVKVQKGFLDGDVTCEDPHNDLKIFQMSFVNSLLDGTFKEYLSNKDNHLVVQADFKVGLLDGTEEVYSGKTQKLIHRAHWKDGVADGVEERFEEENGNVIFQGKNKNGLVDGNVIQYSPDGKAVIHKVSFKNGKKNDKEEQFNKNGKLIASAEWNNDVLDGAFKQWDADGKLIVDKVFKNGLEVSDSLLTVSEKAIQPQSDTSTTNGCIASWIKAYRNETSQDAIVTADQMSEWGDWCKQGKSPK